MRDIIVGCTTNSNTDVIQHAIDTAPEGTKVVLGGGTHMCGPLRLRDKTHLHLTENAILRFEHGYDTYAANTVGVIAEDSDRAMLVAQGATSVRLSGAGQIICDGHKGYSHALDTKMGTLVPHARRPRVLVCEGCSDVSISGVTIADSPMWTLHFVGCSALDVRNVKIKNDLTMPNTDGIVIDSCQQVQIKDCDISTADDGIVLKTSARSDGKPVGICRDITVTNCKIESRSCAIKLGTESHDDFHDISFAHIQIVRSNRGIGLFSRDGGRFDLIRFSDIHLDCKETPDGFWGSGEAITVNCVDRRPDHQPARPIRGVTFERIKGTAEGAINIVTESAPIEKIVLRDIQLSQKIGALGTAQHYDLRPTPADLLPSDDAGGRTNAWRIGEDGKVIGLIAYPGGLPGVFVKGTQDVTLERVQINRPDPLPKSMNPQEVLHLP